MTTPTVNNDKGLHFTEKTAESVHPVEKVEKGLFGSLLQHAQKNADTEKSGKASAKVGQEGKKNDSPSGGATILTTDVSVAGEEDQTGESSKSAEAVEADGTNTTVTTTGVSDSDGEILQTVKAPSDETAVDKGKYQEESTDQPDQSPQDQEQNQKRGVVKIQPADILASADTGQEKTKAEAPAGKVLNIEPVEAQPQKAADGEKPGHVVTTSQNQQQPVPNISGEPKIPEIENETAQKSKEVEHGSVASIDSGSAQPLSERGQLGGAHPVEQKADREKPGRVVTTSQNQQQTVSSVSGESKLPHTVNEASQKSKEVERGQIEPTGSSSPKPSGEPSQSLEDHPVGKEAVPKSSIKRPQAGINEKWGAVNNNQHTEDNTKQAQSTGHTESSVIEKIISRDLSAVGVSQKPEIIQAKLDQIRENKYKNHLSAFAERGEVLKTERPEISSLSKGFSAEVLNGFKISIANGSKVESGSEALIPNDEIFWKNHQGEMVKGSDSKGSDQLNTNFMRLGQLPVSNISMRRILPAITQNAVKAAGSTNPGQETWQKHSFILEDGNNIQLSARQIDGVMQLKLSASQHELGRLLQLHHNEIKEHLEKELNLQVDLHFEAQGEQDMSGFSEEFSGGRANRGPSASSGGNSSKPIHADQNNLTNTVRKFGYNQKEWTV